jgi:hypothetical protein
MMATDLIRNDFKAVGISNPIIKNDFKAVEISNLDIIMLNQCPDGFLCILEKFVLAHAYQNVRQYNLVVAAAEANHLVALHREAPKVDVTHLHPVQRSDARSDFQAARGQHERGARRLRHNGHHGRAVTSGGGRGSGGVGQRGSDRRSESETQRRHFLVPQDELDQVLLIHHGELLIAKVDVAEAGRKHHIHVKLVPGPGPCHLGGWEKHHLPPITHHVVAAHVLALVIQLPRANLVYELVVEDLIVEMAEARHRLVAHGRLLEHQARSSRHLHSGSRRGHPGEMLREITLLSFKSPKKKGTYSHPKPEQIIKCLFFKLSCQEMPGLPKRGNLCI